MQSSQISSCFAVIGEMYSYWNFIYLYSWNILEAAVAPCWYSVNQVKKEILLKVVNPMNMFETTNKRNNNFVKQSSGPTIHLGKDNESKLITR